MTNPERTLAHETIMPKRLRDSALQATTRRTITLVATRATMPRIRNA
jgi:hypothetical protein